MSTPSNFTMDISSLEADANTVKSVLLAHLLNERKISQQVYDDYMIHCSFILKQPKFFSSWWTRLMKKADIYHYILVRNLSLAADAVEASSKPETKVIPLFKKKVEEDDSE